jgi:hypothetical protein
MMKIPSHTIINNVTMWSCDSCPDLNVCPDRSPRSREIWPLGQSIEAPRVFPSSSVLSFSLSSISSVFDPIFVSPGVHLTVRVDYFLLSLGLARIVLTLKDRPLGPALQHALWIYCCLPTWREFPTRATATGRLLCRWELVRWYD